MKLALCNVNGEFSYNLTRVELFKKVVSETAHLKDDDVLLVYTMNKGGRGIDKNVMTIHLYNGELGIYDENGVVLNTLLFDDMDYKYYRVLLSGTLAEFEYKERYNDKESRAFEQEQFEQAEAAKENADFRVYIGSNIFKFIGRGADDLVYKVLEGLFSSLYKDEDTILIINMNTGDIHKIEYVKTFYTCMIKINDGETMSFEYYKAEKRRELMNYIKKAVIL